jgi:hypothetical protein
MYIVRFSYDILPKDRDQAIALIRREVDGARAKGLTARLLVPLTRGQGGPGLQYEVEMDNLGLFDDFRTSGVGSSEETGDWMREFSALLTAPPIVEILRVA